MLKKSMVKKATRKRKPTCRKCANDVDINDTICVNCGAILTAKRAMLGKKDLKNLKEI